MVQAKGGRAPHSQMHTFSVTGAAPAAEMDGTDGGHRSLLLTVDTAASSGAGEASDLLAGQPAGPGGPARRVRYRFPEATRGLAQRRLKPMTWIVVDDDNCLIGFGTVRGSPVGPADPTCDASAMASASAAGAPLASSCRGKVADSLLQHGVHEAHGALLPHVPDRTIAMLAADASIFFAPWPATPRPQVDKSGKPLARATPM